MNAGEISAIITVSISVLTVIIIPIYKKAKRDLKRHRELEERIIKNEEDIAEAKRANISLSTSVNTILHNQDLERRADEKERAENLAREIRDIKVYINMIYYSYDDIKDIPNEMFINGFGLCTRYISLGQNHEMKPICDAFTKEYNRRICEKII